MKETNNVEQRPRTSLSKGARRNQVLRRITVVGVIAAVITAAFAGYCLHRERVEEKQKAEELSTLNNNFAKKVEELMASEKSLSGMWEGQAKEAFENAFNTDAGKMNQFKAAVDEYYSRLLTIVSQYEQAESKNVSVGTTRTV